MAIIFQGLVRVTTDTAMAAERAIDVSTAGLVTVSIRKPVAGGGTLFLQHGMTNEEGAFTDIAWPTFNLGSTTPEVLTFTPVMRYLRWRSGSVTGSPEFLLDAVLHRKTANPLYVPLIGLNTPPANPYTAPLDQALDLMNYGAVTVAVNISVVAASGSVLFQTAPTLDEKAFTDLGATTVALTNTGIWVLQITALQRYLRWRVTAFTGSPTFQIDLVARER